METKDTKSSSMEESPHTAAHWQGVTAVKMEFIAIQIYSLEKNKCVGKRVVNLAR